MPCSGRKCNKCGKLGHFAAKCPVKSRTGVHKLITIVTQTKLILRDSITSVEVAAVLHLTEARI